MPPNTTPPARWFTQTISLMITVCLSIVFTVYVFGFLKFLDTFIGQVTLSYAGERAYTRAQSIFVIVSIIMMVFLKTLKPFNLQKFIIAGLAIFFPLNFVHTSLVLLLTKQELTPPHSTKMLSRYVQNFCPQAENICGEAMAYFIYNESLRALPLVATAPIVFWVLLYKISPLLERKFHGR